VLSKSRPEYAFCRKCSPGIGRKAEKADPLCALLDIIPAKKVLSPLTHRKEKPISIITTPVYLESITQTSSIFCKVIAPPAVQPVDKRWPDVEVVTNVVEWLPPAAVNPISPTGDTDANPKKQACRT
jgi:hypothetical protein